MTGPCDPSRTSRDTWIAVAALVIATLALFNSDFKSFMAADFKQAISDQAGIDDFVATVVSRQDAPFDLDRVFGRRIEIDTSIDGRLGAFDVNSGDRSGDPVLDRSDPGHGFRLMTTQCPGDAGRLVPLYVYLRGDVDSGTYAWLPRTARAALAGMWDVQPIRTQQDGSFCTVDLRLVPQD
ncbi:hypothetical protein Acsp06_53660 [Actinomycetospora sp. NBRC 106375]|nr:hypothetical protein Acsp06_53660 [Actinomycetospora sp. NBRC 106375]